MEKHINATENTSSLLGFGIGSSDVFNIDYQNLPAKKEVYLVDSKGKRTSLDVVNSSFHVNSLSAQESLAQIIREAHGNGEPITANWHPSRHIATFAVPLLSFDIVKANGRKDAHKAGVMLACGYSGQLSYIATGFFNRLICSNGARLRENFQIAKIRNSKNAAGRIGALEVKLDVVSDAIKGEIETLQHFANTKVSDAEAKEFITRILAGKSSYIDDDGIRRKREIPTQTLNKIEELQNLYIGGRGNAGGSLFDIYNAFTEYTTHSGGHEATRLESATFGAGFSTVSTVRTQLEAMLQVA